MKTATNRKQQARRRNLRNKGCARGSVAAPDIRLKAVMAERDLMMQARDELRAKLEHCENAKRTEADMAAFWKSQYGGVTNCGWRKVASDLLLWLFVAAMIVCMTGIGVAGLGYAVSIFRAVEF